MLPWNMYVVNKDILFRMFNEIEDEHGRIISTSMADEARMILSNDFMFGVDKLVEANLDIDVREMYLILTGSSLALVDWLETANVVTGLYPFMSLATKSNCNNRKEVYDVALMDLDSILQRKNSSINTKYKV